jgi:hypothetical protein
MKIRNGFVSNSSSSNFVLVGFMVPTAEYSFESLLDALYPNADKEKYNPEDWYMDASYGIGKEFF